MQLTKAAMADTLIKERSQFNYAITTMQVMVRNAGWLNDCGGHTIESNNSISMHPGKFTFSFA